MTRTWLLLSVLLLSACSTNSVMEHQPTVAPASEWDQYLAGCGWNLPDVKPPRMVVDLVLIPARDKAGLTKETRAELTTRGALILFPFATNVVRVEADTANIPVLVTSDEDAVASAATTVTNYEDFAVTLRVEFSRPFTAPDLQELEALGAEVFPQLNGTTVIVLVANALIDEIKELDAVTRVEAYEVYCVDLD